jgi:uncharacterized protein (DUF2267 family)
MSATGLDVFDKTIQTTNIWLNEIMSEIGPDRRLAWHVLGAVLHALRDRLQPDVAAHLAAQLPIMVRGAYYDGYKPSDTPDDMRSLDEFLSRVAAELKALRPVDAEDAVRVVCGVIARHVDDGQASKVWKTLPVEIRRLAISGQSPSRRSEATEPAASRARATPPSAVRTDDPRKLARQADTAWRATIDEGMYGEAPAKTGKDAAAGDRRNRASRPH